MSIAYSYLRFSHPSQAEGDSVRRQIKAAEEWSARNGVPLDTATTFRDLGTSAFLGEHRKNPERNALAAFLEMIKPGEGRRILPGSYLILESLDRLTREHIQPALALVLNILQSGIKIVQLKPVEMVYDSKSDTLPIMMMIVELSRGHSESAVKSVRIREAWDIKKQEAKDNKTLMRAIAPPWLSIEEGRFKVIERIADVYRRIFQLAIDGTGSRAIASMLNNEGVHRPARVMQRRTKRSENRPKKWTASYVSFILNDRRLLGEHEIQARLGNKYQRTGETIPGYYPPIIGEGEWDTAKDAMKARREVKGRNHPFLLTFSRGF